MDTNRHESKESEPRITRIHGLGSARAALPSMSVVPVAPFSEPYPAAQPIRAHSRLTSLTPNCEGDLQTRWRGLDGRQNGHVGWRWMIDPIPDTPTKKRIIAPPSAVKVKSELL